MSNKTALVSARCRPEEKRVYENAAKLLQLRGGVSELLLSQLDVTSGRILEEGWEARMIYLDGSQIVGFGAEPPLSKRGVPLPVAAHTVVAPALFWTMLERELLPAVE